MNKQAFTFLTLFTLVLMLAVYYVTLPIENPAIVSNDLIASNGQNLIESLQDDLDDKHDNNIEDNEQVVADNKSTTDQKLEALDAINSEQQILNSEIAIQEELNSFDYQGCLVEIESEVTRVMCPNTYNSKENATKLMSLVYGMQDEQVLVEVSFD